MADNRRHPRKEISLPVAFQVGDGPRLEGVSHDISLGGMFIETTSPAPFGSHLRLFLTFPGQKQELAIKAFVRWTKPNGMGVQFGMMGARDTHILTQMLGSL